MIAIQNIVRKHDGDNASTINAEFIRLSYGIMSAAAFWQTNKWEKRRLPNLTRQSADELRKNIHKISINHSTQYPDMNKRNFCLRHSWKLFHILISHRTNVCVLMCTIHALKCKAHKSISSHFPSERMYLNLKWCAKEHVEERTSLYYKLWHEMKNRRLLVTPNPLRNTHSCVCLCESVCITQTECKAKYSKAKRWQNDITNQCTGETQLNGKELGCEMSWRNGKTSDYKVNACQIYRIIRRHTLTMRRFDWMQCDEIHE